MTLNTEQQWREAKADAPEGAVVILRDGPNYHAFDEDAKVLKYALGQPGATNGDVLNHALSMMPCPVVFAEKHAKPQKYAESTVWVSYTGKRGGKGWQNTRTGNVVYGGPRPGDTESGEGLGGPPIAPGQTEPAGPPKPTMQNPIPLPPGVDASLGASPAAGIPGFNMPPEGSPGDGQAADIQTTEGIANLYGHDGGSGTTEARYNASIAKSMGLEVPRGMSPEDQENLVNQFLTHNSQQLRLQVEAAESYGHKPRGKKLTTRAASSARYLITQAEDQGWQKTGNTLSEQLQGASNHLMESESEIQAHPGLQAAYGAYKSLSMAAGPLIALPLAAAWGFINRNGSVQEANEHIRALSDQLGIQSPFVAPKTAETPDEEPSETQGQPSEPKATPKARTGFDPLTGPRSEDVRPSGEADGGFSLTGEPKEKPKRAAPKLGTAAGQRRADEALRAEQQIAEAKMTPEQRTAKTARLAKEAEERATFEAGAAERKKAEDERQATQVAEGQAERAETRAATIQENTARYQAALESAPVEHREKFAADIDSLYDHYQKQAASTLQARRTLLGQMGVKSLGSFTKTLQRADDADSVRKFDEMVQLVESAPETYAPLFAQNLGKQNRTKNADTEERLMDALSQPESSFAAPPKHEVAEELAEEVSQAWALQEEEESFDVGGFGDDEGGEFDVEAADREMELQASEFAKKFAKHLADGKIQSPKLRKGKDK